MRGGFGCSGLAASSSWRSRPRPAWGPGGHALAYVWYLCARRRHLDHVESAAAAMERFKKSARMEEGKARRTRSSRTSTTSACYRGMHSRCAVAGEEPAYIERPRVVFEFPMLGFSIVEPSILRNGIGSTCEACRGAARAHTHCDGVCGAACACCGGGDRDLRIDGGASKGEAETRTADLRSAASRPPLRSLARAAFPTTAPAAAWQNFCDVQVGAFRC